MNEETVERYLVRRVKELRGEVRKVKWIGRRSAPDRLVMLPADVDSLFKPGGTVGPRAFWVEVKNPDTIRTFPADARERAQAREHERMRRKGLRVEVVGTIEQVEALLS